MTFIQLEPFSRLVVHQRREWGELLGFETRNKYEILNEEGRSVAFAAEQQKGAWGFILRNILGHWRTFDLYFFTPDQTVVMMARHPFRWIFQKLEIFDGQKRRMGTVEQRFSLLHKRFEVRNARGEVVMEVSSPLWKIWTFEFLERERTVAKVSKQWSGLFNEAFTDKDKFLVEYLQPQMSNDQRSLILASALFIDLLYFEKKAR